MARIPQVKKPDFFSPGLPARNYNDIFLAMARNLFILARRDWPRQGKIWSNSSPMCPGEENFIFFFLPTTPRQDLSWIFSCRDLASPQKLPNRQAFVCHLPGGSFIIVFQVASLTYEWVQLVRQYSSIHALQSCIQQLIGYPASQVPSRRRTPTWSRTIRSR